MEKGGEVDKQLENKPDKIGAGRKETKAPAEKGGLEQKASALLPMSPKEGPPLPRMFSLRWPWKK